MNDFTGEIKKAGVLDTVPVSPNADLTAGFLALSQIAEAPYEGREKMFTSARDSIYLGFANNALSMLDDRSIEEQVAVLEFTGSAIDAYLPEAPYDVYFFGSEPEAVNHTLNVATIAIRLEEIRERGKKLAQGVSGKHLRQAFPPKEIGINAHNTKWQTRSGELRTAINTCVFIIRPQGLPEKNPLRIFATGNHNKLEYTEKQLLRAAQILTEAGLVELDMYNYLAADGVNRYIVALASLRDSENGPQLTDSSSLDELTRLEVAIRASAIIKTGRPKHGQPGSLIEHGEFVFHPNNNDEEGTPKGLTPEEAEQVRTQHIANLTYMSLYAYDTAIRTRAEYAEMLSKYTKQQ